MPSSHLILCHPLFLLTPIPPSIRVFSNESTLHIRWPKYWSFSFSISPSNEHPGLISFRMDWLDLLAVQGTLKRLLQHHSSKASILRHSAFFTVQLSHPYVTTGKTIALTRQTFVGKVMSLLFSMLSRLVITFLPRSKRLLISWLQSPSAVILEPQKIKSDTVSTVSPSISHELMGPDAMIFKSAKSLMIWLLLSSSISLDIDSICYSVVVVVQSLSYVQFFMTPWTAVAILAAAAAKSLQSCPTLCNPTDGSPPGSAIPGILQARTLRLLQFFNDTIFSLAPRPLHMLFPFPGSPSISPPNAEYRGLHLFSDTLKRTTPDKWDYK